MNSNLKKDYISEVMLIACRIVKCQYWNLIFSCCLVDKMDVHQVCILYFVALYTPTSKPRNRRVLGNCTVSKNHKLRMINYQYSLVFTNFTTLFCYVYVGES